MGQHGDKYGYSDFPKETLLYLKFSSGSKVKVPVITITSNSLYRYKVIFSRASIAEDTHFS